MRVKTVELKEVKYSKINKKEINITLNVNNGFNNISVSVSKDDMTYEDLINHNELLIKGVFMRRNCCSASPIVVIDSENDEEKQEAYEMIDSIVEIIGEEIKEKLAEAV